MGFLNFIKRFISRNDSQQSKKSFKDASVKISSKVSYSYNIDPILTKKFPNGLLPGEVLLINWMTGKISNVQFPRYFETTYGINAQISLNKLLKEGYVVEASAIDSLSSLKLPELKEILKSKELKVSGKKADLISRIGENCTNEEVESFIDSRMLEVTNKGDKVLEEYYYIVPAHRNDSKDGVYNVASSIRHVNKFNYKPNNGDVSWALFQEAYMNHSEEFKYGLMCNDIRNMAAQLESERKYKDSLFHYLRVYIIDLSGLSNTPRLDHPKLMMYEVPSKHKIKKLLEVLEYDDADLQDFFVDTWDKTRPGLKYHYLTSEECFRCLTYSLKDEDDKVEKALFNAYDRLNKTMQENSFSNKYGLEFPSDDP
ncbi:SAP domain-containing protein [Salipaludibacillus sp. CF4.18]|uniref:SAP domain-containing protein n=1 Tax=Salipaludibacillus sp. CF4.18 TaxID=3373081 RepID=UPI003EE4A46B